MRIGIRSLPGAISALQRAHVEHLLQTADDTARAIGRTASTPGNHAGRLEIRAVTDPQDGSELQFVSKHVQGSAEVAASRFAQLLGIDHLVPIAVRDGEAGARMVFAAGQSADAAAAHSAADLVALRIGGLEREAPALSARQRARIARMEVELAQVFDYLLANSDRRVRNLLVDRARGTFALIDNASIGHGTTFARSNPTRPTLKPMFQGPDGRTELSKDTVAWVRAHLDEPTLRAWHAEHASVTAESADDMVARLAQVLEHGSFEYTDAAMRLQLSAPAFKLPKSFLAVSSSRSGQ